MNKPDPADGAGPDEPPVGWEQEGTELAEALVDRARATQRAHSRDRRRNRSTPAQRVPGAGWSGPAGDERDPQPLDVAVDRLVDEHGWGPELAGHGVVARWEQVVGADIAAHVWPERYADGELSVRADSTAWATQMRLLAPNLVRRLNEDIGTGTVTRVIVRAPHAPSWRKGQRAVRGRGPRDTYG
jgi:predicted nucleic acid-binding Zn ribbon protein